MSKSVLHTAAVSQTETMIRNLQAAGFSEEDIHYEISGYGSVATFARLLGYEPDGFDNEPTRKPTPR
jgi:hypothetical protein